MLKIEKGYLVLDKQPKKGKIYTTKFGALCDKDKWNKKGDMLLSIWGFLPKESIDPFYTKRGECAEMHVKEMLEKQGKDFKWFGAETTTYDMFETNQVFGGNLDFIIGGDTTLEIKSKNIKDFGFISKNGASKEHLAQARLGTYLSGLSKGKIKYVFFTNEQEEVIRKCVGSERIPPFDLKDIAFLTFDIEYDEEEVMRDMQSAYDYYINCYNTRKIPVSDISQEVLDKLGVEVVVDIFAKGISL